MPENRNSLKHVNDHSDAFHLAHLMRLGILPTGYIHPKEQRAIRDLCRKRLQRVRHRVTHMLSAQNQIWRSTGENITTKRIKQADFLIRLSCEPQTGLERFPLLEAQAINL